VRPRPLLLVPGTRHLQSREGGSLQKVGPWDPGVGVANVTTPPSSWFLDPNIYSTALKWRWALKGRSMGLRKCDTMTVILCVKKYISESLSHTKSLVLVYISLRICIIIFLSERYFESIQILKVSHCFTQVLGCSGQK
jgi:hypothetical protein